MSWFNEIGVRKSKTDGIAALRSDGQAKHKEQRREVDSIKKKEKSRIECK